MTRAAIFIDGAYLLAATRQTIQAVLLAGDSDFVPAMDVVKQHGVLVILWHGPIRPAPGNTVHRELWEACDERFPITKALEQNPIKQNRIFALSYCLSVIFPENRCPLFRITL